MLFPCCCKESHWSAPTMVPCVCRVMEEYTSCSENVTRKGNTWMWPWPCCSLHREHLHTSYVILLFEKIMAGSGHIHYPNTYSASRSGTHRQKSYLLPWRRRGGNQGKWGMLPPVPTSLITGSCSWGMKECQVAMGHVMCFALLWYAYPLSCYELIWCHASETFNEF